MMTGVELIHADCKTANTLQGPWNWSKFSVIIFFIIAAACKCKFVYWKKSHCALRHLFYTFWIIFDICCLFGWWLHLMFRPLFGTCSLTLCKAGSVAPHCLPYMVGLCSGVRNCDTAWYFDSGFSTCLGASFLPSFLSPTAISIDVQSRLMRTVNWFLSSN